VVDRGRGCGGERGDVVERGRGCGGEREGCGGERKGVWWRAGGGRYWGQEWAKRGRGVVKREGVMWKAGRGVVERSVMERSVHVMERSVMEHYNHI